MTGGRFVSVPSSDHCEPLIEGPHDKGALLSELEQDLKQEGLHYVDFHSNVQFSTSLFRSTRSYCFHLLDLRPDLKTLFQNCHKNSIQRKIRRAERENLVYESGRSDRLLKDFLRLYALTRRRHRIPPQPGNWFRNLIRCFGESLTIRVASKGDQPVAATLSIRHKDTVVFKYGCSDARHHNLGGTPLLFWKMIEESKGDGVTALDLGRSDLENEGLITFKDRLGANKSSLTYSRFAILHEPATVDKLGSQVWKTRLDKHVLSHLPDRALYLIGYLLYRHIG